MTTIAVTGASGNLGRATLQYLTKRQVPPANIVLVVRDPAKVQGRTLQGFGLPPEMVGFSVALGEAMRAGEFDEVSSDLAELLGRAPTDLNRFLSMKK